MRVAIFHDYVRDAVKASKNVLEATLTMMTVETRAVRGFDLVAW